MKLNTFLKSTLAAALCIGLGSFTYNAVAQSITGGGGGGANSGVAPGVAYYATNGTAVSDGGSAVVNSGGLNVTGSTIPANGMYLGNSNQLNWATNTVSRMALTTSGLTLNLPYTGSRNPSNSESAITLTGTINTSGTGTTNFPHLFIQPTGTTAATTWSTSGTGLGMNLASGFTGNFLDFRTGGGATTFQVSGTGTAYASTRFQAPLMTRTGAVTAPSWTTSGIGLTSISNTFTDSSSTGTVAAQYVNAFKAPTIAASSATTFTNSYNVYFEAPVAGTNVTQTSAWALGADSARIAGTTINTSGDFTTAGGGFSVVASTGSVTASGNIVMNNNGTVFGLRAGGTQISSPASASLQLGAADVDTAPVAQTLRSQGALTGGTNNVAGADWTFIASPGKGTGAGGRFLFQTAAAGSSGNTQNTPVTALTISSTGLATFSNSIVAGAGNSIAWSGLSIMRSSADGSIVLLNQATTGFTSLQFGGLTSSFPSIKRTTTALNIRLADDSADAALTASNLTLSGLSASSAVCTDGSKVLTTSGCSSGGNTTMTSGTFTPTVVGNGTAGTTTYVTQTGRYRKFTTGSVTQWSIDIYVRGTLDGAATGNVVIGGLPFTVNASSVSSCSVSEAQSITFGAGYTQLGVEVVPSSTTLILNVMGTATTFANVPVANWGSNAFVKISCAIDE